MATYFVDNGVLGNPLNSGLSDLLPKAHPENLIGILVAGDIVRIKATGTDYVWTTIAANTTWAPGNVLVTNYTTDTTKPNNYFNKPTGNFVWLMNGTAAGNTTFNNVQFTFDYGSNASTTESPFVIGTGTSAKGNMYNGKIVLKRTSATLSQKTLTLMTTTRQKVALYNTVIEADNNIYTIDFGDQGYSVASGCTFKGFVLDTNGFNIMDFSNFERNTFEFAFGANTSKFGTFGNTVTTSIRNNDFIIRADSGGTYTNCHIFVISASSANLEEVMIDNIFYSEKTGGQLYMYRAASAITIPENYFANVGNNPYYGFTALTNNLTGWVEQAGVSPAMASSPFLSTTYGNANYCKLNNSNADAISYCIGTSPMSINLDAGRYESSAGGGSLPNASDLRAGVVVDTVTGTLAVPAATDVRSGVAVDATTGNMTSANPINVKTGSGTYGANGTEYTPSYSPDFPDRVNVAPDDTVDGLSGTMDLPALSSVDPLDTLRGSTGTMDVPALNKVAPSDTLRGSNGTLDLPDLTSVDPLDTLEGSNGTMDLPALSKIAPSDTLRNVAGTMDLPYIANVSENDTLEGVTGQLHIPFTSDILPNELKIGVSKTVNDAIINGTYDGSERFIVPIETDVRLNVNYMDNLVLKTGLAEVGATSTDPGVGNVIKPTPYMINGVPLVGEYDTGELDITPDENNIRVKILKKLEDKLYGINPANSNLYQNVVRSVSFEPILEEGLIQDDFPHVQIVAERNEYDHKFVLSGNIPMVTMKVRFIVTSPANWNALDCESLYYDIRQCLVRDAFNLDGLIISSKVESFEPIDGDSDKPDQNRKGQLIMVFKFLETIE